MAMALLWHWVRVNGMQEGRDWMCRILSADDEHGKLSEVLRARLTLGIGILACYQGEGVLSVQLIQGALDTLTRNSAWRSVAQGRWALGFAMYGKGELDEAIVILKESLEFFDTHGHRWWCAAVLNLLGFAYCAVGDYEAALAAFERNDEIWTAFADGDNYVHLELGFARVAWRRGELARALEIYCRCVRGFPDREHRRGVAYAIEGLARVKVAEAQWELAAQLFGVAGRMREELSLTLDAVDMRDHEVCVEELSRALGDRLSSEWHIGYSVAPRESVDWVLERVA
jgi:tetratricopeptide (TPR) repeat protein